MAIVLIIKSMLNTVILRTRVFLLSSRVLTGTGVDGSLLGYISFSIE